MPVKHTHIRAFHAVATHGGFSAASSAVNLSQPTLSDHISALEQRSGVRLFNRLHRGVELTATGKRLLKLTSELDRLETEIDALLSAEMRSLSGLLRIGADAPYQLMPIAARFRQHYPNVELRLEFGNSSQLIDRLIEDQVDLIIAPNLEHRKRFHCVPLQPDRLEVIVPSHHPWSVRRKVRLDELLEETLLLREEGSATRAIFDRALRRSHLKPRRSLVVGSREAVREAVAAGLGISVIPVSEKGDDPRFHFLEVSNATLANREYIACLNSNRERLPIRHFLQLIQETA